jgi:hypothetical protein
VTGKDDELLCQMVESLVKAGGFNIDLDMLAYLNSDSACPGKILNSGWEEFISRHLGHERPLRETR